LCRRCRIHSRREQRGVGDATGRRREAPSTAGFSPRRKIVPPAFSPRVLSRHVENPRDALALSTGGDDYDTTIETIQKALADSKGERARTLPRDPGELNLPGTAAPGNDHRT